MYSHWTALRVCKQFSLSLAGISALFAVFQGSFVVFALVNQSSDAPKSPGMHILLDILSIHLPTSFFLFSFLTRDMAVFISALLVARALKAQESERLSSPSTLETEEGSEVFHFLGVGTRLNTYWRQVGLALLILAGVVYPSLLSLPFYLAYLITFGAWSLDSSRLPEGSTTGASGSRADTRMSRVFRVWESVLVTVGGIYVAGYLMLIYLFQTTVIARRIDAAEFRRYGIMNVVQTSPNASPVPGSHLVVFILHVATLGMLFVLATSIMTSKALSKRGKSSRRTSSAALQVQPDLDLASVADRQAYGDDNDDNASYNSDPLPVQRATNDSDMTTRHSDPMTGRSGTDGNQIDSQAILRGTSSSTSFMTGIQDECLLANLDQRVDPCSLQASPLPPAQNSTVQAIAQWLVAKYGLYVCFLVYITLALQRPTILGFVFMAIVMVAAVVPNFVFRACAPVLLVYTTGYAAAVYWFGSVAIRNGYFATDAGDLLGPLGLVNMDPFRNGWWIAGIPLCMVTLLGFTWKYREDKLTSPPVPGSTPSAPESPMPLNEHGNLREWITYLEEYLVAHNLGLYFCLQLCFAVGVSNIDVWHFPFVFAATIMVVFPLTAPYLWLLVVGYTQGFILYQYWRHFYKQTAFGISDMILPVVFFVFACRQYLVYVHAFRRRYFASRGTANNTHAGTDMIRDYAAHRRARGQRPSSRQLRAVMSVNGALYVTKILLRLVLLSIMWHLAFHSQLTVFSVGYMVLLAVIPMLLTITTSFRIMARDSLPRLFRAMAVYGGLVICLVHIFCSDRLTGLSLDDFIGARLRNANAPSDTGEAMTFMILNWTVQFLAATQTEILRQQDVNLKRKLESYPVMVHGIMQVLPFLLVITIFAISWEFISVFGAVILYLGMLHVVVGRKMTIVWRLAVTFSATFALIIAVFDFGYFERYSSLPILYWLGLRRGRYVPDPDATPGAAVPEAAKGWTLSSSSEAYMIIAFLAGLQFFYTAFRPEIADARPANNDRGKSAIGSDDGTAWVNRGAPGGAGDLNAAQTEPKAVAYDGNTVTNTCVMGSPGPSPHGFASQTPAIESEKRGAESSPEAISSGKTGQKRGFGREAGTKMRRAFCLEGHVLENLCATLYMTTGTALSVCKSFSFEFCIIYTIIAALLHANLISMLYLSLFIVLVTIPQSSLKKQWTSIVHALVILVIADYLFILRLPPDLVPSPRIGSMTAQYLGSRQCSIFSQYMESSTQSLAYTYSQWFGLCIPDDASIGLDFVMLLLAIIQNKRFKGEAQNSLTSQKPLFARLTLIKPSPKRRPKQDAESDNLVKGRMFILQHSAYVIIAVIVILSTLTFNFASLGYLLIVALMVQSHAQEGLLTARRFLWKPLAIYAWSCLTLRIIFQIPGWPTNWRTGSGPVLLGLRKVYNTASGNAQYPPEMVFDAVILILLVVQCWIFVSPDFPKIMDELWYAEQYDHVAQGCHVVKQLEKIRDDAMQRIRVQITTMYEQLDTIARARLEQSDNRSWENFLLKNRNAPSSPEHQDERVRDSSIHVEEIFRDDDDSDDSVKEPLLEQTRRREKIVLPASATPEKEASLSSSERDSLLYTRNSRSTPLSSLSHTPAPADLQLSTWPSNAVAGSLPRPNDGLNRQLTSSEGGGRTSRIDPILSLVTPKAYRPALISTMGPRDEDQKDTLRRSQRSSTQEPSNITMWIVEALNQTKLLQMKDPLKITDKDLSVAVAANEAMAQARTPTMLLDAPTPERRLSPFMSIEHRRTTAFSPVLAGVCDEEDTTLTENRSIVRWQGTSSLGEKASEGCLSPVLSSAPPSALPIAPVVSSTESHSTSTPRQESKAPETGDHPGWAIHKAVEEQAQGEKTPNKGKSDPPRRHCSIRLYDISFQAIRNSILFFNYRSTYLVYIVLVVAHMYEPSLLNLIYPLSVFGYALLQNPRSLPRIGDSLIHPMVQNPPRYFWHFLLAYSFAALVMKFVFQFPYFCVCGNQYSRGGQCPSALPAHQEVCKAQAYPHLDYFVDQPIVRDYFLGVFKAYRSLNWNHMSVRNEPVDRFVPAESPGRTSRAILDSGLGGAFLVSFLGDFLVLLAVLWHTHILKIRGVWLLRDPEIPETPEEERVSSPSLLPDFKEKGRKDGGKKHEATEQARHMVDSDQQAGAAHPVAASPAELPRATPPTPEKRQVSVFSNLCWPWSQARTKPGCDLYVSLFFIQCILFFYVLLAYQHADQLFQSVRENQMSGGFILVLLLHFVLIVADRCLYLHRSIKGKYILQLLLLVCIYSIIHSNFTFRIGINQNGPVFAWYLIMCAYLFVSALQISYGYPPFIQTNWMTKRAHHFWGNIFRLYRSLPFLYELRMLLDWTCTPTTLYLGEWVKLEDIYSGIFITECDLDFMKMENRKKGDRQPARRKWLRGFLFFAALNLLIWLPLFVFSTGSLSQFENYVKMGSLSVQLNGFPMLYEAATADYISPLLPPETWSALAQVNPALGLLPATSTNDYMHELQFVRLPRASQELWKISPPAEADLLTLLEGRVNASTDMISAMSNRVEMTLQFTFGTQDGSTNQGSIVHSLAQEEKQQLAEIIRGTRTSLRLQSVLPSVIRISTTREVTPLIASGDILTDCMLAFTKLGDEVSSSISTGSGPGANLGQDRTNFTTAVVGWWDLTCGNAAAGGCATAMEPRGQEAATVPLDPETGEPEAGCNPSVYTISSEKTIGSYFAITYGIIGLYFTVVFTIGRFVHMSVM